MLQVHIIFSVSHCIPVFYDIIERKRPQIKIINTLRQHPISSTFYVDRPAMQIVTILDFSKIENVC